MVGFVNEAEQPELSYYNEKLNYSYVGETGVNAGVMLMNLTRMRNFDFITKLVPIAEKSPSLKYGDQCILNILFSKHTGKFSLFSLKIQKVVRNILFEWHFFQFIS